MAELIETTAKEVEEPEEKKEDTHNTADNTVLEVSESNKPDPHEEEIKAFKEEFEADAKAFNEFLSTSIDLHRVISESSFSNTDKILVEYESHEEAEKIKAELPNYNLLDLTRHVMNSLNIRLNQFDIKQRIDSIESSDDNGINKSIQIVNLLKRFNSLTGKEYKNFDEFKANYEQNLADARDIYTQGMTILKGLGDKINKTSFVTEVLCSELNELKEALNPEDPNYDNNLKDIEMKLEILGDRTELSSLWNKFGSFLETNYSKLSSVIKKAVNDQKRYNINSHKVYHSLKEYNYLTTLFGAAEVEFFINEVQKAYVEALEKKNIQPDYIGVTGISILYMIFIARMIKYKEGKIQFEAKIDFLNLVDMYLQEWDFEYSETEYIGHLHGSADEDVIKKYISLFDSVK